MHSFQSELRHERIGVEVLREFQIFYLGIIAQNMASEPSWGPCIDRLPEMDWIGPTNDPWMISDEFETFGDNHFWRGQTKTKIFVKKITHFINIQNIYSKQIFIL